MNLALRLLITLIVAAIGGTIGLKLKMPAGALTGALITVVIFNLLTGVGYVPTTLRSFVQMFTGALIGSRIKRNDIHELKLVIWPTILLLIGMVIYNFIFGIIIMKLSGLDIYTSFLSVAPGGMSDMPLIAADMGGDQVIVALMQLLRMIFIFIVFPQLYRKLALKELIKQEKVKGNEYVIRNQVIIPKGPMLDKARMPELLLTVAVGIFGGTILWQLDVTAGALIGSMIATSILGVATGKGYFPQQFRRGIQMFVGGYLGSQITADSLSSLENMLFPLIIMFLGIFIMTFGLAELMKRSSKLSRLTCLLACTPGGLQEMSIIADEMGSDAPKIAVMQTARLIFVISTFPTMTLLASHFIN